jgi:opacity protein-like surface antigen
MKSAPVLLAALWFAGFASAASADDSLTIPPLTIDPHPEPSIWNGLYVGTGVTFAAAKGQKGQFGGDVFVGYDKTLENHLVLGVNFDTGYAPFQTPSGRFHGFDYAMTNVKLGYDFGRVTPYIYAGGGLAHATAFNSGFPNADATINGLFSGPGGARAVTTLGAGVDYHVTNNVTVGVSAGVIKGPGGGF